MEVIKKLLKDDGSIGIMVSSQNSNMKMNRDMPSAPLAHLRDLLSGERKPRKETVWSQKESNLGVGYFVNVDEFGRGTISSYGFNKEKKGRFFLITLFNKNNPIMSSDSD